jgi:hypothetical protein
MRRRWLRGVMLAVCLAMLLAGGVALARGLSIEVDQNCFECWPRASGWPPPGDHEVVLTFGGYEAQDVLPYLCFSLEMAGVPWDGGCFAPPLQGPPCHVELAVECQTLMVMMVSDCQANSVPHTSEIFAANTPTAEYGQWIWSLWLEDGTKKIAGPVTADFTFAEDCSAQEFVPEPGTILLLGSGLAGLAGYGALRWRTRE